jgi:NTE family protein
VTARLRFSLALGGGGARGLAHVGVLQVLAREGLAPIAVAGTSMGAIIGALYAAGVSPDRLLESLDLLDLRALLGLARINLRPDSVLSADPFEARLREVLPATFEELTLPFAAVATDLLSGDRVVLTGGDLPLAVRASMSLPVVFEPVRLGDALLVDGGVVDPIPVDAARELGGDPVLAVDVGPLRPFGSTAPIGGRKLLLRADAPTTVQVGTRAFDVAEHWLARPELRTAAAVIAPDVSNYSMADFLEGAKIIAEGARAADACVGSVRGSLEDAARSRVSRWWRRTRGRSAGSR